MVKPKKLEALVDGEKLLGDGEKSSSADEQQQKQPRQSRCSTEGGGEEEEEARMAPVKKKKRAQQHRSARTSRRRDDAAMKVETGAASAVCEARVARVPQPRQYPADTSEGRRTRKSGSGVSFGTVDIVEFRRAIGDNPAVSGGVPIALDYRNEPVRTLKVGVVEYDRSRRDRGRRSHGLALRIRKDDREQLLLAEGYARRDIIRAVREAYRRRMDRERSYNTQQWDNVNERLEKTSRKFKTLVGGGGKKKKDSHTKNYNADVTTAALKSLLLKPTRTAFIHQGNVVAEEEQLHSHSQSQQVLLLEENNSSFFTETTLVTSATVDCCCESTLSSEAGEIGNVGGVAGSGFVPSARRRIPSRGSKRMDNGSKDILPQLPARTSLNSPRKKGDKTAIKALPRSIDPNPVSEEISFSWDETIIRDALPAKLPISAAL